jgi:hypothetical protein
MSSAEEAAVVAGTRLAEACAEVLGETLVAAILHGSLTTDDFWPGTSDLDLLLVVEHGLSSEEADALVEAVRSADMRPAGGVDLLVVTRQTAALPADRPARELLVGWWPGSDQLEVEGPDDDVPDLWPELSEARAHGRSLLGADPGEVLAVVPVDRVRANAVGWLRTWLGRTDDDKNAVLMVLTACRMWGFEMTGEHLSKTAAGRWALRQDPSLTGVARALAARTTSDAPQIAPGEVEAVLLRVLRGLDEPARG